MDVPFWSCAPPREKSNSLGGHAVRKEAQVTRRRAQVMGLAEPPCQLQVSLLVTAPQPSLTFATPLDTPNQNY